MKTFAASIVAVVALMVMALGSASTALALTPQKITFGKLANKTFGAAPITVSATASSGLPVTFASTTTGVCTVAGNTVTLIGAGKCTIRASQSGNATYAAAPGVDQSFTVGKASQTISFPAPGNKTFDATPLTVSATASSGLPLTFTSTTTSVCTVAGAVVTFLKTGTCTIRAAQPGNANYNAAATVNQSFTIAMGSQTINLVQPGDKSLGTPPFTLSATASSGLPVSLASLTPSVCTVSGSTVTLAAAGTCTIRASQPGNATYSAAANVDRSFMVTANVNVTIRYTHDAAGNLIGVQRVQ